MEETAGRLVNDLPSRPGTTAKRPSHLVRNLSIAGIALVVIALAALVSWERGEADQGLLFTIPEGSYENVAIPGIDSAITIPTSITFDSPEEAIITIVNEDVVDHRAGPFLVGAGQTFTQRFPQPGEYPIACSVDPAESVVVTVKG
jgi:hypothetical protein